MKNKISIYLNMLIICLSICVISIGVYSLTSANLTISGSLGYVYHEKSITATAQNYSTTAGGALQSTATNLTISEPKYNSTYGSNMITITLPNDIYFSGIGWDAPHIEILVKVKNTEDTNKAVTLLFDDMEGLGYTRKVIESAEKEPENITTNHSSAIILSKGEQTTFRLTLKQSIRKTNLAVSKDELNIQLSVADYDASNFTASKTDTETTTDITYTLNSDLKSWSVTSCWIFGDVTFEPIVQGLPVNIIDGLLVRIHDCTVTIPNSVTDIKNSITYVDQSYCCYLPGSIVNLCPYALDVGDGELDYLISKNYIYNFETIGNGALIQHSSKPETSLELELQSEDLKTIGSGAFAGWHRLTSITIPSGVTSIGSNAFATCYSLIEVVNKSNLTITAGSTDNGGIAQYAKGVITDISQTKLTKNESDGYYVYNESDTSKILLSFFGIQTEFTVPSDITLVNAYAFYNCDTLTKVTIPSSVTSIGNFAFYNCSNLATVTLNTGLKTIGNKAFNDCSALTSITIPSTVTSIGDYAFYGCSALTSITIPSSVTSIGNYAFQSCTKLATVTFQGTKPPTIGSYIFSSCSALTAIKVPSSAVSTYKDVSNLSSYSSMIKSA